MEIITTILLVAVLAILIIVLLRLSKPAQPPQDPLILQQQLDALRQELTLVLKNQEDRINSMLQQVNSQAGAVATRLDNAANVIGGVQTKLGELSQATREIKELGQSVSKLEEMLRAPKLRGGLGELLLEDLLKQVLPASAYSIQYRFKRGQTVDAVIHTSGGNIVPIDSKFPLENFEKMVKATSEQEKRSALQAFRKDVRKHIDTIAEKYILPDEGTFDFALMYIPAENIYYETIIKDESGGDDGLYSYAIQKHVVPVSPNSFYAYLRVIALGFKGLQIEKQAQEILRSLSRLDSELVKFQDIFETLGVQLKNAINNYDKADRQLSSFADRLKGIQERDTRPSLDSGPPPNQLDVFGRGGGS